MNETDKAADKAADKANRLKNAAIRVDQARRQIQFAGSAEEILRSARNLVDAERDYAMLLVERWS